MGTAVIAGVALATTLLVTVALVSFIRRRDETPEERLVRAKRDQEKSRKWMAGGYGAASGHSGCAGGGASCGGGSSCGGGGCGGGGCGGGGCGGGGS